METAVYLSEGAQQPIFSFVSCDVDYVVSSLRLTGWENYRLWLTVGFWVLAHHCPLSQSSMREGSLTTEEEEEEEAGWLKGEERESGESDLKRWGEKGRKHEVTERWRRGERGRKERWRREGGWAECQGLFHLCSPGLSELPPPLTSVMSSMKRPLGGMEDLTRGSDCDRHQLTLPSQAGFCSN